MLPDMQCLYCNDGIAFFGYLNNHILIVPNFNIFHSDPLSFSHFGLDQYDFFSFFFFAKCYGKFSCGPPMTHSCKVSSQVTFGADYSERIRANRVHNVFPLAWVDDTPTTPAPLCFQPGPEGKRVSVFSFRS